MDDVELLTNLYGKYQTRSTETKSWVDYLKAHGLANACLERTDSEEWRRQVYKVESDWYGGKHPLTYPEHLRVIELSKQHLKGFRDASRADFDSLRGECKLLDSFNTFSNDNIRRMEHFTEKVFELSEQCCEDFVELVREIFSRSVAILEKVGMAAPCPFAIIGFGSLARGEATPYSDLEYGILVQTDTAGSEYFEKLAVDSYFRIGNHGETPLKCFDIAELKTNDERGNNKFTDRLNCVGLKIDGISPKAGNIPTGNGQSGGHKLTATVDGMVQMYIDDLKAPAGEIAGDLSDLLCSSVLLYSNKDGSDLHHQFRKQLNQAYQSLKICELSSVLDKKVTTFVQDIEVYSFLPSFHERETQRIIGNVKVKTDIFRYPTLLAVDLRSCFALQTSYSWETFSKLKCLKILNTEMKQYIHFILAAAIYIRTSAYLAYDSQKEELSFFKPTSSSNELYYIPSELFVIMCDLLIPLKKNILSAGKKMRKLREKQPHTDYQQILKSNMTKFKIDTEDYMLKAEVLRYASGGDNAVKYLITVLGEEVVYGASNFITKFRSKYGRHRKQEIHALSVCAVILYEASKFEVTLDFCNHLLCYYQPNTDEILNLAANCNSELYHFETSIQMNFNVIENISRRYEISKDQELYDFIITTLDDSHRPPAPTIEECLFVVEVYNGLAYAFAQNDTANHGETASKFAQAEKQICTTLYNRQYIDLDQFRVRSLKWMQSFIYSHFAKHEYIEALEVFDDMIEVYYILYGRNSNHPGIACQYSWIASVLVDGLNIVAESQHDMDSCDRGQQPTCWFPLQLN